jgi:DNA-binding beta-propeller fold protein YncE
LILIIVLALVAFLLIRRPERQVATTGSFSFITSVYGLETPLGVAADDQDNFWISNTGLSQVLKYDINAVQLGVLDTKDENGEQIVFNSPYGIEIDNEKNRVYVSDYNWRGVRVLTKDGDFLFNIPRDPAALPLDPALGWAPYDSAVYQDRVYVTSKDGVWVFDDEGNFIQHWGTKGTEQGQYDYPNGIAADPNNGNIYVADTLNRRIVALNPGGEIRWILGPDKQNPAVSTLQLPRSVFVDQNGHVYVTDTFAHMVLVFDTNGKLLTQIGGRGTADAQFNFPEGIAVSPSGRMYIADRENGRVQIWQTAEELPEIDEDLPIKFEQSLTVLKP